MSLTNDESNLGNQSDSPSSEECSNYMTFITVVKSESKKESENVENLEQNNSLDEGSKDEREIYEACDQLFEESLKLNIVVKLEESTRSMN